MNSRARLCLIAAAVLCGNSLHAKQDPDRLAAAEVVAEAGASYPSGR